MVAAPLLLAATESTAIVALVPVGFRDAQELNSFRASFEREAKKRQVRVYSEEATSNTLLRYLRERRRSRAGDEEYRDIRRQMGCTHLVVVQVVDTSTSGERSARYRVYPSGRRTLRSETTIGRSEQPLHAVLTQQALDLAGLWDREIIERKTSARTRAPPSPNILPSASIPPRPRRTGFGPTVAGWVLFGVGAVAAIPAGLLAADLNSVNVDTPPSLVILGVGGAVLSLVGFITAMTGHHQLADSNDRLDAWDRKYGHTSRRRR